MTKKERTLRLVEAEALAQKAADLLVRIDGVTKIEVMSVAFHLIQPFHPAIGISSHSNFQIGGSTTVH